ncbi:MAG: hypothetical protein ACE5IK_05130 [Acidobacteriota bacterium]
MLSPAIPTLKSPGDVPTFLGSFFASGRSDAERSIEVAEGLWTLLEWCWSRPMRERGESALCQALIAGPGHRWLTEDDVVDAMARRLQAHDPSRLTSPDVAALLRAFISEEESVRGDRPDLTLSLEFVLPPIAAHPVFEADRIIAALAGGPLAPSRLAEHLRAVHPERRPYRGAWRVTVTDRDRESPHRPDERGDRIAIDDDRIGSRSRLELALGYEPEFAGYFRLSVGDGFAGEFQGVHS